MIVPETSTKGKEGFAEVVVGLWVVKEGSSDVKW
jgi:hypothetical protein